MTKSLRSSTFRIGTRGSPLAKKQAEIVRDQLCAEHPFLSPNAFEIVSIKTSGDRIQDRLLSESGGKGLFTKEIEEALVVKEIDFAVHSMKDVATVLQTGLMIDCMLLREDPRDAWISSKYPSLRALPKGARVGTSSFRRSAQILKMRPDLEIVPLRGNVETRLKKIADGKAEGTLLAVAGLKRLGLVKEITAILPPTTFLPAVAQGVIGVQRRSGDQRVKELLARIDHFPTRLRVAAERAFLRKLDGSCHTPIAGYARYSREEMILKGLHAHPEGMKVHQDTLIGTVKTLADARELGTKLGGYFLKEARLDSE